MLSEDELQALREIERRLRWTSPELERLLDNMGSPPPENRRRKRAPVKVLVATAALAGLTLRGPRMLNEAEARAQQRPPPPRTPPLETIVAPVTASDPAASVAPVAVIDLSIGALTPRATATCQARARDTAVALTEKQLTTGPQIDRRAVSIGLSGPQSPSSADRDVRAESESSW